MSGDLMMHDESRARTGAKILVDQLTVQGVNHVFCVPGESYLAVLDALYDTNIHLTVARQETGAGIMADANARLTGRPGVVFTTRGPGAMNAAHAIHIAEHDSVPLIMFVGQIERSLRGRGAFQEMDFEKIFAPVAKWAVQVDDPARIPETVSRAFHTALQGRQGPVVIALPEDVLVERTNVADAARVEPIVTAPGARAIRDLETLLEKAKRPIAILGGGGWTEEARRQFGSFAKRFALPVACSFRRTPLFDADHECYAGELALATDPALVARVTESDLVFLIGGRLAEVPSQGYTLIRIPNPSQTFVHAHAHAEELGRVYHPHLGIHATPPALCASLDGLSPRIEPVWAKETEQAHRQYVAFSEAAMEMPGSVQLSQIMLWLRDRLPANCIVTNGAGNYAIWSGRYLRMRRGMDLLAPISGSMGYGLPAAVGAKRVHPERMVVSFNGDGCFLMNGQEFATAVQYDLPIIAIVVDNSMYGTIRMHQEREYPGRVSATMMRSPDFAAIARAYGGYGETVENTDAFAPAFERAVGSGVPALIHVRTEPDAITPATTLRAIREKALGG
jgi:acetolactate synthase-1/2/3 large subunit